MARIRTIKPEYWSDATIAQLDFFTRLLYIAMWNFADDEGRARAIAKELSGFAFPLDDSVDTATVENALNVLHERGRIILYHADGQRYFQIVAWRKHQVINRPSPSHIPPPEDYKESPNEDSLNTHGGLTEPSSLSRARAGSGNGSGNRKQEHNTAQARAEVSPPAQPAAGGVASSSANTSKPSGEEAWDSLSKRFGAEKVRRLREQMSRRSEAGEVFKNPYNYALSALEGMDKNPTADLPLTPPPDPPPRTAEEIAAEKQRRKEADEAEKQRRYAETQERLRQSGLLKPSPQEGVPRAN